MTAESSSIYFVMRAAHLYFMSWGSSRESSHIQLQLFTPRCNLKRAEFSLSHRRFSLPQFSRSSAGSDSSGKELLRTRSPMPPSGRHGFVDFSNSARTLNLSEPQSDGIDIGDEIALHFCMKTISECKGRKGLPACLGLSLNFSKPSRSPCWEVAMARVMQR